MLRLKYSGITHWGQVTHICVGNLVIIGSDNGLSPSQRQAIIWTNGGILSIGMEWKMSSGKWRPFCVGLNVITGSVPLMPWLQFPSHILTKLLTLRDKLVLVFHGERFQLPLLMQCWEMLENYYVSISLLLIKWHSSKMHPKILHYTTLCLWKFTWTLLWEFIGTLVPDSI